MALDAKYGPVWSVVLGKNFGLFASYQQSQFAHFFVGRTEFVVFKAYGIQEEGRVPNPRLTRYGHYQV